MTAQQNDAGPFDHTAIEATEYMRGVLRKLGRTTGEAMPSNYGFALMLFTFTGPEFLYISSAVRADVVRVLKQFISHEEAQK